MNSFTPCFPPGILEKCLDLAKCLTQKKTGKATLELNLGNSRFKFSLGNTSNIKSVSSSGGLAKKPKKKSPSDRKRDAMRIEKYLEEKRNSSAPSATPSQPSPTPSMDSTPSVDSPVIEETPQIADAISPTPPMELPVINESPQIKENDDAMEIVEDITRVPVITETRNKADDASDSTIPLNNELTQNSINIPPLISPICSPIKTANEDLEQIHLLFCAPNQSEASKLANGYPQSQFVGPHPKNKKHHFFFSTTIHSTHLPNLKENINEMNWPNVLLFRVVSEGKNYHPDEQDHCQACRARHLKK